MKTVLYISRCRLPEPRAAVIMEEILEAARVRNRSEGVTGALIFTGARFAQLLEGPPAGVDRVMSSILLDPRHDQLKLISVKPCPVRRFEGWDMAYGGLSSYVDRHIRPLFQDLLPVETAEAAESLVEMMLAFTERGRAAA